jgi:hypothetical protein
MSLEQYKDATRKELWEILQIQVERIAELEAIIFNESQESKQAVSRAIDIILEKDEQIAELDKDKTFLLTQRIMGNIIVSTSQELSKQVHIHNLEQQAKALSDARNDFTYSSDDICVDVDDLDKRIERLQGQAKALKEKGNE